MIAKGFRFGMLLQFSIGPVCLFVFNTAGTQGFCTGLLAVLAAALTDALFILFAGTGVSAVLRRQGMQNAARIFGFAVLTLFAVNIALSAWGLSPLSALRLFTVVPTGPVFLQGMLVTGANPLTILFWSGVFSAEAADRNLNRRQLALFGAGCVLSTLAFLTVIAGLGSLLHQFLPKSVTQWLNLIVGTALFVFALRLLLRPHFERAKARKAQG